MAKKVILKDLNDIEVLPITRGELVLDSSGNLALHSTLFLATDSLPGLMSSEDKYKLDHLENSGPGANNKVAQINTTTNDVYRLLFSETADDTDRTEGSRKSANLTFNPSTGVLNLTGGINANNGTLSGTSGEIFRIDRTNENTAYVSFWNNKVIRGYLGVNPSGEPVFANKGGTAFKIWHTGNFNPSNYLPLTGGVLSGHLSLGTPTTTTLLILSVERNSNKLRMLISGANEGWLSHKFSSDKSTALIQNETRGLIFKDTSDNYFDVWHSGNLKNLSDLTDDIVNGKYLPLSGGTVNCASYSSFAINRTTKNPSLIQFKNTNGVLGYLGFGGKDEPVMFNSDVSASYYIWHTGNLNPSNYLPLTGGTVSGNLTVDGIFGLTGYINTRNHYLFVKNNDNADWVVTDKDWNKEYTLIHTGNISSQSVSNADKLKNKVKIWGLDFDGSSDVSGYVKGNYFTIGDRNNAYIELLSGTYYGYIQMLSNGSIAMGPNASKSIIVDQNGNVSIGGSTTISLALSVTGTGTFNNQIISNIADGTAPLTVISTTKVTNLHADRLDGYHASDLFTNLSNSDNNISITIGGTNKTLTPAYAANANTVDGYHMGSWGHYKYSKTVTDTTNAVWYIKIVFNINWNSDKHYIHFNPNYNNIQGRLFLSLSSYDTYGYLALVSNYNECNIKGFYIHRDYSSGKLTMYLKLAAYTSAQCIMYSTLEISSATVISAPSVSFIDISTTNRIYTDMRIKGGGFIKNNSDDSYVLLGGGGHKALSDFAMSSAYVKKSGDTMTGKLTMTGGGIIITTNTDSNYRASVEFYKGTAANTTYTYDAQIGWHNTGGDGTGSICILPYATSKKPWERSVGLWLSKDQLLFEGDTVLHSGNSSVSGGGSSVGSSITVNIGGISKTLTIPSNASTASKVYINNSSNNSVFPVIFTNREPCGTPRNDNLYVDTEPGAGYNPSTNAFVASAMTAGVHNSTSTLYLDSGSATTSIIFRIGGTEKVRIALPNGNVGIGTTSPNLKLHVIGSVAATSSIIGGYTNTRSFHAGGGETYTWIDSRDTSNNIKNNIILYDDKTSTRTLTPFDTNTYSLGTSDLRWSNIYGILGNFKASVAGIITLQRTHTNGGAFIDYYNNNQTTNFWRVGMTTDGDFGFAWKETLTNTCIKKNGYVGVLTTTVSYPLSVNGAAQVNLLIVSTANLYREVGGIILNNSDIWGLNAIYTLDLAEDAKEGYLFKRSDGYYDSLWCKDGVFYFSPKGNFTDGYKTNSTVLHSGNYTNYTVKKDGTGATGTWVINITGNAGNATYLTSSSLTTEENIVTTGGVRAYTGSGSSWTGSITSMRYAGILTFGNPSRGWLIWASRGTGTAGNLRFRVGNDDASAWEALRTILDNVNSSVSGGGSSWGSSITVNIGETSKTLTIPANPNTDYRALLSETTTSYYRPLVLGYTSVSTAGSGMTGSVTNQVYLSNNFYVQPSTGTLYTTRASAITYMSGAYSVLGYCTNAGDWTGGTDASIMVGSSIPTIVRSSGDDLYHYHFGNNVRYKILDSGNSSVSKSGETLTVKINGTSQSLTNSTYNFSGVSFTSGNSGTGSHDCNAITTNGHWYYNTNGPATSLGASTADGALYSQAYSSSWVGQIAQDYRTGHLFTRGRNNGTWTAWKAVTYDYNTFKRFAWWANTKSKSVNDLRGGTTFVYTSHGAPTTGTIAAFDCSDNSNYTLQLLGSYTGESLFFRNRNGDNSTWNAWRYVIHSGNIGSQSVNSAGKLTVISCYNGTTNNDLWSTVKSSNSSYLGTVTMYEVYNDGGPTSYGHVLDTVTVHSNHWQPQLWMAAGKNARLYYRNKDYNDNSWGNWNAVAWTGESYTKTEANSRFVNVSGDTMTGNLTVPSLFINTGDPTLKIYSGKVTADTSDGNICLQTCIDGRDGQTHDYAPNYQARENLVLLPRGGQVYIGTNPDGGNTSYKLYVNGAIYGTSFSGNVAWGNITGKPSFFSGNYNDLTNKPTIPSVGNGTVTIKLAGVSKGSFTMNQSGNTTIELTDNNTTYSLATSSTLGLVKIGYSTSNKNYAVQLDSSGKMYVNVPWTDTNTTYTLNSLGIGNVKNYDQSKAIKSITRSGTTFTYTCLDGTTGTFTQLDNNTTYSFAAKGSATKGIYLSDTNTFTAMTYSLNATVNSGTTSKLAYYSGANAISAHTSTVGSSVLPIYLKAGVPTACSVPMVRYWATYSVVFSSTNKITKIAGNHDFFNYNSTVVPGLATGMGHTANFPSGYNIDNTIISIIRVSKASTNSESYFTIPVVYVSGDSLIVQSNNKGSFQLSFICIG